MPQENLKKKQSKNPSKQQKKQPQVLIFFQKCRYLPPPPYTRKPALYIGVPVLVWIWRLNFGQTSISSLALYEYIFW